jgi:hypothetical protein
VKDWKTTTSGIVLALSGYVAMFPQGFDPNVANIAKYINLGGLVSLGIVSRDAKGSQEKDS